MPLKNLRTPFFIILFISMFFFVSPVSSEELCGSAIPEAGQKFVKIKVTNSETPSGGQDACISVPENSKSLSFQDLLRAQAEDGRGLVAQNWGDLAIDVRLIRCNFKPNVPQGAAAQFENQWLTLNKNLGFGIRSTDLKLKDLNVIFDPLHDCAMPSGGDSYSYVESRDENLKNSYLPPNDPKFKRRWGFKVSANETKYIFALGEQKRTNEDSETLNICRQQLFQQIPRCNTADNPGLQAFIAANNLQIALNSLGAGTDCETAFRQCVADVNKGTDVQKDPFKDDPRYQTPNNYQGPLPDCSFSYDGCRNVNDILVFFIKIGQTMFQVIGTFAFVMFIYGGFTIILSMGNAERVRKGQEVLVAAVVGILIAFSAYLIIDFVLDALQVGDDFRSIGAVESNGIVDQVE